VDGVWEAHGKLGGLLGAEKSYTAIGDQIPHMRDSQLDFQVYKSSIIRLEVKLNFKCYVYNDSGPFEDVDSFGAKLMHLILSCYP
jgi:hypothetical protein